MQGQKITFESGGGGEHIWFTIGGGATMVGADEARKFWKLHPLDWLKMH